MQPFLRIGLASALAVLVPFSATAGKPAARAGDTHVCPLVTGTVPHTGGTITTGVPTVLVCGKPAATVQGAAQCMGPANTLVSGAPTVLIGGKPAVRVGDRTAHGGTVSSGCGTVLIGG